MLTYILACILLMSLNFGDAFVRRDRARLLSPRTRSFAFNFGHPTPKEVAKKLPKSKVDLWCRLVSYLFNTSSSAMMSRGQSGNSRFCSSQRRKKNQKQIRANARKKKAKKQPKNSQKKKIALTREIKPLRRTQSSHVQIC